MFISKISTHTNMIANKHDTTKMKTMFFLITLVMSLNDISINTLLLLVFAVMNNYHIIVI